MRNKLINNNNNSINIYMSIMYIVYMMFTFIKLIVRTYYIKTFKTQNDFFDVSFY